MRTLRILLLCSLIFLSCAPKYDKKYDDFPIKPGPPQETVA